MSNEYAVTPRNRVRQLRDKARYDDVTVCAILDKAFVAQVGFVQDSLPVVMPMIYGRAGDRLYLHGAKKARISKLLAQQAQVCINVTLIDGIVAARSAFNSSLNYRSVNVFGQARLLENDSERLEALRAITEHVLPGRWDELRAPTEVELKQTAVLAVDIELVSAKVSDGEPDDEEEDYALPVWAGVIPTVTSLGQAIADTRLKPDVVVSASVASRVGQVL